jgi:hypothetical protein
VKEEILVLAKGKLTNLVKYYVQKEATHRSLHGYTSTKE